MKGNDFIAMMYQDIATAKEPDLKAIVELMHIIVNNHPNCNIDDAGKTPEDCFDKMRQHASKNQSNKSYCFKPAESYEFIARYLGLEPTGMAAVSTGAGAIVDLEEFL